jgi:hypothetical protein
MFVYCNDCLHHIFSFASVLQTQLPPSLLLVFSISVTETKDHIFANGLSITA